MINETTTILVLGIIFIFGMLIFGFADTAYYISRFKKLASDLGCIFTDKPSSYAFPKNIFAKKTMEIKGSYKNHKVEIYTYNFNELPFVASRRFGYGNGWDSMVVLIDGVKITFQYKIPWLFNGNIPNPFGFPDIKSAIDEYLATNIVKK